MKKLNRREALVALGTAVAVPSVAGLAEAASPVVAPKVRSDGSLLIVSGHPADRCGPSPHKMYSKAHRMGADYHAAVLRLLDGEPLPKDQIPADRYYWTIGYTQHGIHLYLSGPGHSVHAPVSYPEYHGRFILLTDDKRFPVQMKYQIEAYPGPHKTEPLVTLVRFDFLPERV